MDKSKLTNSQNVRKILKLFVEYDKEQAVYTFARTDKEVNGTVFPSLYRLYMEEADLTEARFVDKYMYDWDHWERVCRNAHLKDEIAKWRLELRKKIESELVNQLITDAKSGSKSSMSSAKYLLDNIVKDSKSRGRPSNQTEVPEDTKNDLISREVQDDLERVVKLRSGS